LNDLLEIVEDEKHLALADVVGEAVGSTERLHDLFGDESRVADRCELDPERPGLVVADELGGRLDREARLPRAARPGKGDEASAVAEKGDDLCRLPVPADERARWTRQVRVRDRLQWREALGAELEDRNRALEVLEAVLTEFEHAFREIGGEPRRLGKQHLPTVAGCADPRTEMDVLPDVALRFDMGRARVDPDPDVDRTGLKSFAAFVSRDDRPACVWKREEERVTLCVDLDATVANEGVSQYPPVVGECLRVCLGPELVQQLRRALDVGEHEGDGPDRKILPHSPPSCTSEDARIDVGSGM